MSLYQLIEKKFKDPETKDNRINPNLRVFASVLVILSGLILFADKVTNFNLENNFGFKSTKTFVWIFAQSLSPLLMAFASIFKPYKSSYIVPVYIYFIQIYWIFKPTIKFDDYLLQTYAIGVSIIFLGLIYMINKMKPYKSEQRINNEKFIKETKETIAILKNRILEDA
ncbi:hypothetical protein [Aquimarina algiphila]|uniref:Uncharacterized protein n=1 Tax=Aquimarina algiphila TaxID=2047982 RepID=A0A554VA83_9FLAO|nr:hypothetical protein [Aquimarina algiphila]TSE02680.1 hypothetical protein FOF46_30650 [Aquimarina algiphila]